MSSLTDIWLHILDFMLAFVCFLHVQVSDHRDPEDCDLLELRNESATFSTSDSVGIQVSLHR